MKVMAYNILHGFCKKDCLGRLYLKPERVKHSLEVVKSFSPDLLAICEASLSSAHSNDGESLNRKFYAETFGYPYSYYGTKYAKKHISGRISESGSVLLSRYPLTGDNFSMDKISFLRTSVDVNGKSLMFDVIHPHPRISNRDKMQFVRSVIRDRKDPYIIAGDFNSVSPEDVYDKEKLIKGLHLVRKDEYLLVPQIVDSILKAETVSALLNNGLIDTYRKINPGRNFVYTNPTQLFKRNLDSAMRLDYIFCSNEIGVLDAGIIKNELTDKASDHYPVYATLELP